MLSALSLVSMPFFPAIWIISMLPSPKPFFFTQPLPRVRPTLGAWAAVIVILAVDFAVVTTCVPTAGAAAKICLGDCALMLVVIVSLMTAPRSALELWSVAMTVGMLGYLVVVASMPVIAIR